MDAYPSNPHVSADETFLNLVALAGGDEFPRSHLREAGVAFYGVPSTQAGINLFRFAAQAGARALSSANPRNGFFRRGVIVAMTWRSVGADAKCIGVIHQHLKRVFK